MITRHRADAPIVDPEDPRMRSEPHRRGTRRAAAALLATLAVGLGLVGPAAAPAQAAIVKSIAFPVEGTVSYTDDFGAPRSGGRTHEGNDLMGKKMQRLLSAVDGTVKRIKYDNLSAGGNSVVIEAADGWTYHYIHVNNDTPGTDDGKATRDHVFPPSIQLGSKVTRGQVIAYMGDSGNAEGTAPHLHFEIRQPPPPGVYTGDPINPYESLRAAQLGTTSGWQLRTTATAGTAEVTYAYGVQKGDKGLLCDWDGDGLDESVIVRGTTWHLASGVPAGTTLRQITFGQAGETPLCGDVDGDGVDEPVMFRAGGTWSVRNGFETADGLAFTVRYGLQAGDRPVLGDWDGDGDADLAIHRTGVWHLRSTGTPDGVTTTQFKYGIQAGDLPVAGDWDGNGRDDAGIYRRGEWHLRATSTTSGTTASVLQLGLSGEQPVVGTWGQPAGPGIGTFRARTA
jgi:hypothetical protein